MHRVALFALTLLAPISTLPCSARAQSSDVAERVNRFIAPLLENGDLSGAILIGTPDSILFLATYGMADYERGNPNTPDTRFLTASVTKTLTAAAIALLQEEGALSFQDSLSRFIPDCPHGNEIMIEHLLAHMSGADNPDYLDPSGSRLRRSMVMRLPTAMARRSSSSRSGSFMSQCATRRNISACGPPPS